jgi:hypothetical protein
LLSTYDVPPTKPICAYGPPEVLPRYKLYPTIFEDVLAVQFKVTLCETGTAVAVKFTPVIAAPFTVTEAVDGVNTYPDWLAATTYEPFAKPENVYFPVASVVVDLVAAPERVSVAADPLTDPEIVYNTEGLDEVNTRSTQ